MTSQKSAVVVGDAHARWECDTGASLIADAMTPGPGRLGTLHGVIYVCPDHQASAEEQIARAGYQPDVRPAPPGHKWDPWPCGHATAYSEKALAGLSTLEQMVVTKNPDGSHSPAYDPDWPAALQLEWTAAVTELETGLRIQVRESRPGWYSLSVRGARTLVGNGPMELQHAYGYLDGLRAAVTALQAGPK